jgi:outer membrane receptor for ferrienterochelin and colicins
MSRNHVFFLLFMGFTFLVNDLTYSQNIFISVTDKQSREPVSYAHVRFDGLKSHDLKYDITSIEGKVKNDVKELTKITISYVGYVTFVDTIRAGQSVNIELKPAVLNMDEVVVTAQYEPVRMDKSIYPIEVISSQEISQKAAMNVADLLKTEVNMNVTQNGVFGTSLTMQGMSGENVKFLVDGVPMIGRMNGQFDLNQINLFNVDHVEIVEGPMSVIYGSNATAGVVNLITKENKTSSFATTCNMYTESVGIYNFDASVSANIKQHGFSITGGRNFFGGYSLPNSGRTQAFLPYRQYFFNGYYVYNHKNIRVKASGDYFNELLLDRGTLLPPYFENAYDSWFTTIRYTGKLEAGLTLHSNQYLALTGAYSWYSRIKQTYYKDLTTLEETPSTNPEDRDTTGIWSVMGRGTYAKNNPQGKLNWQAGFDLNLENGKGKRILGYEQQIGDYALFCSAKWDPIQSLSIQPGVRLIYNTKYRAPVIYALSMKWTIINPLSLRVSYSRGFKAPDVKELYLFFVDINHNVQGNPDLRAETSNNINLNLNYSLEKGSKACILGLSAFYNLFENDITLAMVSGGSKPLYTYINFDKTKCVGTELEGTIKLYPSITTEVGFSETGTYNYLKTDAGKPVKFFWSPAVSCNVSYRFVKPGLIFSLYYKYNGAMPLYNVSEGIITPSTVRDYNIMDFTGTKDLFNRMFQISAGVKNILNNTTLPSPGGTGGAHSSGNGPVPVGWGRTLFLKVTFTFNKNKE